MIRSMSPSRAHSRAHDVSPMQTLARRPAQRSVPRPSQVRRLLFSWNTLFSVTSCAASPISCCFFGTNPGGNSGTLRFNPTLANREENGLSKNAHTSHTEISGKLTPRNLPLLCSDKAEALSIDSPLERHLRSALTKVLRIDED